MNYRISHYQCQHWEIQKKKTVKNKDIWIPYKYPGNLLQALQALLDLEMGENTTNDVKSLETAVKGAEKRILAAIEDVIVERGKK